MLYIRYQWNIHFGMHSNPLLVETLSLVRIDQNSIIKKSVSFTFSLFRKISDKKRKRIWNFNSDDMTVCCMVIFLRLYCLVGLDSAWKIDDPFLLKPLIQICPHEEANNFFFFFKFLATHSKEIKWIRDVLVLNNQKYNRIMN